MSKRRPQFLTLLVATAAFVAGFITSSLFDHKPASGSLLNASLKESLTFPPLIQHQSTQHGTSPPFIGPVEEPLGLSWFKQGYSNPWSFSTLRTGIDQLNDAFDKVIERGSLPRVIVSFTSLPRRFTVHARSTVSLLKQQTYLPDAIYIAIPQTSRRSNDTFDVPQWVTEDPLITILRPQHDLGPATKLIPALEEELRLGNKNSRIITIDDDNEGCWTTDSLLQLYAYSLYFEDAAVGLTGWNVTCMVSDAHCSPAESGVPQRQFSDQMYNFIKAADDYACHSLFDWLPDYYPNCMGAVRKNYVAYADVLEGYKGVVYQPRFFNMKKLKSILDEKTPELFFVVDDVWFAGWLGVERVLRLVINPAIHGDSEIAMKLKHASAKRNISRSVGKSESGQRDLGNRKLSEGGLHSLGLDFVRANHEGVRWFEAFGAWTKDLWKRPAGFKYPNEKGRRIVRLERKRHTNAGRS